MWVWYGTAEPIYRLAQGFLTKARELGCRMLLQMTEGADHATYNDYLPVYWETLTGTVEFLGAQGYLE